MELQREYSSRGNRLVLALIVFTVASIMAIPAANGDLVYEDDTFSAIETHQVEDRSDLRQVVNASEKAQATVQSQQQQLPQQTVPGVQQQNLQGQPAVQYVQPSQPVLVQPAQPVYQPVQQPVYVQPAQEAVLVAPQAPTSATVEAPPVVENMSKSELLRRQRMRQELRNEDLLQTRLEELRIRDEKKRTDKLSNLGEDQPIGAAQNPVLQEQVIGEPLVGDGNQDALLMQQSSTTVVPAPATQTQLYTDGTQASILDKEDDDLQLALEPRGGVSGVTGTTLVVNPRYTVGLGLGVDASENLSVHAGYNYSEYGVALASSDPFISSLQYYQAGFNPSAFETIAMKQNVFELALRIHLLGKHSKFRPFFGGGGAYARSFINFDDNVLNSLSGFYKNYYGAQNFQQQLGADYELSQYLGFLSAGFDVKLSKSIAIGMVGSFYKVLSAKENSQIAPYSFLNYNYWQQNYYPAYGNGAGTYDKSFVGSSLAKTSFYSILANLSFYF